MLVPENALYALACKQCFYHNVFLDSGHQGFSFTLNFCNLLHFEKCSRISIKSLAGTLASLLVTPETTGLAVKKQVHREHPAFAVRRQVLFSMKGGGGVLEDDKTLDSVGIREEGDELDVVLKEIGNVRFERFCLYFPLMHLVVSLVTHQAL